MPSKEHEALVEKVAKAINGPFHPVPEGSPYTLDQLRDIRWQQINDVERKLCLSGAKAVITTIRADLQKQTYAIVTAYEDFMNKAGITSRPHGAKVFRAMLAASALGEQSE